MYNYRHKDKLFVAALITQMETGLIGAEYPLPMKQILLPKRQTPASNGKLTIEITQFVTDLDSLTNNGQLRSAAIWPILIKSSLWHLLTSSNNEFEFEIKPLMKIEFGKKCQIDAISFAYGHMLVIPYSNKS